MPSARREVANSSAAAPDLTLAVRTRARQAPAGIDERLSDWRPRRRDAGGNSNAQTQVTLVGTLGLVPPAQNKDPLPHSDFVLQ